MTKPKSSPSLANIKVVGVGGGGGNAVSRMSRDFIRGVEFIAINTDHQDLDHCDARRKIYIGRNLTRGLGAGMNPDLGRQAAEENRSEIAEGLRGADLVFITAGFGGGTGTGASPVIAEAAKQAGALTIAVITKPFSFEGSQRMRIAEEGIVKLKDKVDALIVIPNDRIFSIISKDTSLIKAFESIDDVLKNALRGIVEVIVTPGIINVDFADIRAVIQDAGTAIVGIGISSGPERAVNAVKAAIHSPLLEMSAEGAKGVLFSVSGRDLKMHEVKEAARLVSQAADPGARIIFGAYHDRRLRPHQIKVSLIATGLNGISQAPSLFDQRTVAGEKKGISPFEKKPQGDWFEAEAEGEEVFGREGILASELEPFVKENSDRKSGPKDAHKTKKKDSDWDTIPAFLRRKKR